MGQARLGGREAAPLPSRLPVLPALDMAASYVVAGDDHEAGGDWFDVLPRPDGRVGLVVGDVIGHGATASAVMAQLRAVALERLHSGATASEVVEALDGFVDVVSAARSATVCVVDLDPGTGAFECCAAGHPPPLLVGPDGDGRYLDPSGQGPIGTEPARASVAGRLDQDRVLLLYTDGIVERPGTTAPQGMVQLSEVAAAAAADRWVPALSGAAVDRVAGQTPERLTRETGSTDDITLLAVQRTARLAPLHLDLHLTRAEMAVVRASVQAWFRDSQVDRIALEQIDHVVTELCANAVEHAYRGAGGPVTLDASLDDGGTLTLTVGDRGRWLERSRPRGGRGLGLTVVQQLATRSRVERSDRGTTVTVELRPWKRPHGARPRTAAPPGHLSDVYVEEREDRSILTACGAIGAHAAGELDAELRLSTGPGSPPLTIDLTAVTVLSSAAVHAIREALDRAAGSGVDTQVRCPPGSVAHQALSHVGILTAAPDPAT